jgi:hypothetical protein
MGGNMSIKEPQHPYARYGLALTMVKNRVNSIDNLTALMLAKSIDDGLNRFRMRTDDSPDTSNKLKYYYLNEKDLNRNKTMIQSSGLAGKGIFLSPTVISGEKVVKNTYTGTQAIRDSLKKGKVKLFVDQTLTKSIAPTTAKINNGKKSQSEPKGTLLEAACASITTICEEKPAAWADNANTTVIPDLPLKELIDFIELFQRMIHGQLGKELLVANIQRQTTGNQTKHSDKKTKSSSKPKTESYKRPPIFSGNYPFAPPRNSAFGSAGLLGAIGKWAKEAGQVQWAKRVLHTIVNRPLYLISYEKTQQVQYGHHVVGLSIDGSLYELINALSGTWIYSEDSTMPKWDSPKYQLFYLMANRFLQLFSPPAFKDMLAIRAEYQPQLHKLFEEYFMNEAKVNKDIVESARELGAWLNNVAYIAARQDTKEQKGEKVKKAKAKVLIELESSAMGARTPTALLAQVITRAGRLSGTDAPSAASTYMDAVATGELNLETAKQLMIAFARLSTYKDSNDKFTGKDNYPIPQND